MDIKLTWSELKAVYDTDSFVMQYKEVESTSLGTIYTIWIVEPEIVRYTQINDTDNASDITDFEASYKASANGRLSTRMRLTDGTNITSITNEGAVHIIPKDYKVSDIDETTSDNYFGFLLSSGSWYITKYDTGSDIFRYVAGGSDYTTNWAGRTGLSYDYFDVVF